MEVNRDKNIIKKALLTRLTEERLLSLFSEGKLNGTVHTCIGQELIGASLSEFIKANDSLFSNHRCHGHFLSYTQNVAGLISEVMGKEIGVSGGIGGSQHLRQAGFYSNGIQGGIVPVATGLAFAHKLKKENAISVVFIGDGTLGEGAIYEAFNIAAKWDLPLLVVLEDNSYAQSTMKAETFAGDINKRFEGFGLQVFHADTWDLKNLVNNCQIAVDYVRKHQKPSALVIETYRLKAHSKGDDIRDAQEVQSFEKKDLLNQIMSDSSFADIKTEIENQVADAVAIAESANPSKKFNVTKQISTTQWVESTLPEKKRFVSTLNETFKELMAADSSIYFLGEDVRSPYGGAFKVAQDLSVLFPERVRNMPISESAIVGLGTGMALAGFRPILEIMFGDFLGLAFDQILNHAAKFQQMYQLSSPLNMIIRTPMGGGRGYGPTHSQTLDRHFLGIPGLRVVALCGLRNPFDTYHWLLTNNCGPTLVIENKMGYGQFFRLPKVRGFEIKKTSDQVGACWVKPKAAKIDVTLFGYGGTTDILVSAAERLFLEEDIVAQVLCPLQIYPFQIESYLEVLNLAPHLLLIEEGQGFANFSSEVISQLKENKASSNLTVKRLSAAEYCIPAAQSLERELLPSIDQVIYKVKEFFK